MTFSRSQYQRNTSTSGRVVDTGPPRTNQGLTGLGAVGGPTGVGAGALRVIVEFLTQYDEKQLKQLEGELSRLQAVEDRHNRRAANFRKQEAQSQGALTRLRNIQQNFELTTTKAQQREIGKIRDLERSRAKGAKEQATAAKALLAQQTGFRKQEITQLVNADRIETRAAERRAMWAGRVAREEAKITQNQQRQLVVGQQTSRMQQIRANVLPKLGSLALGAVGGVFGGAIVGLGFAAAQVLIDAVGGALQGLIDPGKEARETLDDFTKSVDKLAQSQHLTILEATKAQLRELGALGATLDEDVLASAAAWKLVRDQIAEAYRLQKLVADELNRQRRDEAIQLRFRDLLAQNPVGVVRNPNEAQAAAVAENRQRLLAQATREVDAAFRSASAGAAHLAAQERHLANSAATAALMQRQLADSLRSISGMRISGLQDQLDAAASAGPSARTLGIQSQIEALNESNAQAAYGAQLRNIQEERGLVLLERRIRFQGESVNLESLSARGQIVAINARIEALNRANDAEQDRLDLLNDQIAAMRRADSAQDKRDQEVLKGYDDQIEAIQKQGDAQDRLNRLLDLQFRMTQRITRNQGESIGDFLSRRANEQRNLLAEQAALRRDSAIAAIREERDEIAAIQEVANARREAAIEAKELQAEQLQAELERIQKARQAEIEALQQRQEQLQLEVRLQELAEQEKQLAAQETSRKRMKFLQDALKASQDADAKAAQSRQESINRQIEAEQKKLERLLFYTDQENLIRLRQAIRGADTYGEINALSGEVAGAKRVLAELRALVAAGVLPQFMVSQRIANLVAIIRAAESKIQSIGTLAPRAPIPSSSNPVPLQKGGVFLLNNAMNNPFGANIRTGEGGQELGVVLSNRVAKILQEETRPVLPPQTYIINRSDDPYRDKHRFKGVVKDALSEVLE